ncbi:LLM class flavin-dependent oxidoreductase [Salimicrobium halophilum]|uniref:Luciferase family oxidoreductase, group 1 n=1 Tax=Salimicrobium halophilum TaxID=86666 RepID=A0A1G8Q4A1_9BACI|nr:LLM class flavin-dependent oxidoreductase [Salimicrobium halophilum]SDI99543.1 luciferase family oxidoreductase, group 1 [Salimicrobium halophilum]
MKLSVLDQAPISIGEHAETSLRCSVELAMHTESLGFHRYWMAEHHNTNGLASSAPEIAISQILHHTETLRVGSGGVLLPQYSPLKVAETFRMLEAFYPARVDLGLGRSPGGGQKTRAALTDGLNKPLSSFSRQVKELQQFLHDELPKGHDYFGVKAKPATQRNPEVWVLGLSERGAKHAALNGTGFTYGYFISPSKAREAIDTYRERFTPKFDMKHPRVTMCIFAVCADTEEEAEFLAKSQDHWLLQVEQGLDTRVYPPEEIDLSDVTDEQRIKIETNRKRCLIGTPSQVAEQLKDLSEEYQVDEFLLITNIFDFEKKKMSYKKIKQAVDALQ